MLTIRARKLAHGNVRTLCETPIRFLDPPVQLEAAISLTSEMRSIIQVPRLRSDGQ